MTNIIDTKINKNETIWSVEPEAEVDMFNRENIIKKIININLEIKVLLK